MNWLKVAAVAIGALLAFFIVGEVVHIIMALLGYALIAALVAGGGYVAYRVLTSGRGRAVRDRRDRELRSESRRERRADYGREDDLRQQDYAPPPRPNVDDELGRLKREMGH